MAPCLAGLSDSAGLSLTAHLEDVCLLQGVCFGISCVDYEFLVSSTKLNLSTRGLDRTLDPLDLPM